MPTPPPALSDAQLLELLTTALAPEPPEHHVDMLMTGYDLRHVDDLVAAMTHDSESTALAGTRATVAGVRELTFTHGDVTIDVEIAAGTLVGQVIGVAVSEITLETRSGPSRTAVDEAGRFRFEGVAAGPMRLLVDHGGRRVVTTWQIA